jgi:dipeptidyl-peptidase-4
MREALRRPPARVVHAGIDLGAWLTRHILPLVVLGFVATTTVCAAAEPQRPSHAAALEKLFSEQRPFRPTISWLPDEAGVWFAEERPTGRRWIVVDAATGRRREGDSREALELPLPEPRVLEPQLTWGRSPAGGVETEILLVNAFDRPVRIFWVDFTGRPQAYGTLAPGETRRQHTYANHVWLADFKADDLAGVFIATQPPGRAVFDERARGAAQDRRPQAADPAAVRVFVRDHDLFVEDSTGTHQLTTDGSADDSYAGPWEISPDRRWAFGFQTAPAENRQLVLVESAPRDQLQPRVRRQAYLKPGDRIAVPKPRLFDLVARASVPITAAFTDPWSIDHVRWADDSREVFCLYNRRGHQLLRLCGIDVATGTVRTVVEESSDTFIDYSQKTFLHWLPGGGELLWASERDGFNHLFLVDVARGSARQLTRGAWNVRQVERVDHDARQVWFTAMGIHADQDPYHRHLARVGLDGGAVEPLTSADGTHAWEFSPGGRLFIDRWSRVDQPWVTELRRATDGALVAELGRDDAGPLLAAGFRPPQRFVAKGRDGRTDIHGLIIRPRGCDTTRKYAVIEDIYAGPQDHHVPKAWGFSLRQRLVAECGFIVVQIDGMGTNWRSKSFHDVCFRNLADSGLPDRIAWLKAAAQAHPELDLDRVGIFGGSAGGQSAVAALLHHGDVYDAAVADCGCHDNRLDKIWWNEAWMGWPVGPHYEQNSNSFHAAKLGGRLLLTVGELDTNVDPAATFQLTKALIEAGKDFESLVVPGGGHGVGETPYLVRKRQDFFLRTLGGPRSE